MNTRFPAVQSTEISQSVSCSYIFVVNNQFKATLVSQRMQLTRYITNGPIYFSLLYFLNSFLAFSRPE